MIMSDYSYNGYPIKIIQEHEQGEQKRKHKKKRINKKWKKRYGVYETQYLDKNQVLFVNGEIVISRKIFNEIKKILDNGRIATKEESLSIDNYIKEHSVETGINFHDLILDKK